ncbi:DUF58 domain-containing protein [Halobellus captivus]|uniref:DUF58 domain-containing protein n=1 Tax=Halobellus captivus TaxID=2592614 RepID=UPI001EF14822|nr:DUF58 domain-containing protein [Halobellus captivus]
MSPRIRLTRRGYALLAVLIAAFAAGTLFGPRTLDAVVLPGAVALLAGAVYVWRTSPPELERRLPKPEEPGTTDVVELRLSAPRPYPVTVRDRLPTGIVSAGSSTASEAVVDTTADGDTVEYAIERRRRGRHEIGPASVAVTDLLGLVERTYEIDSRETIVVYPPVKPLSGAIRGEIRTVTRSREPGGRDEFDTLREYVPGDSLRDVHWKSSAKRTELVVREFTAPADIEYVTVAAETASIDRTGSPDGSLEGERDSPDQVDSRDEGDPGLKAADAMATAAATLCLALLDEGSAVTLHTPSGSVEAAPGRTRPLLEHLATATGGAVASTDADVRIVATDEAVRVRFAERTREFDRLAADDRAVGDDPSERRGEVQR